MVFGRAGYYRWGIVMAIQALPQRYTSATLIARGGMGEVYRATDSVLERKVAVKLLSERYASDPEVRARFQREALAAARLSSTPHVITIFDVGEHQERPYLVMEYLVGGSVHDRLREGPVPTDQALDWLEQAGKGLDRAHQEGVVHRDVKPANLLLDREGKISVTDFGIASTSGLDTLTLPGTVLGTAGYLSPEQARGDPATAASDRYGLGVVAFELLTGRRPFAAETAATEAFAHVNAPVPSAEHLRPGLPDGMDEVFARALAKDARDRPSTCSELVADLRRAFRGAAAAPTVYAGPPTQVLRKTPMRRSTPTPASAGRSTHRSGRRPPSRAILGAAALLLAGLAAAVLLGVIRDDDSSQNTRRPSGQTTRTTPTTAPTPTTETTATQTTQTTETTETTGTTDTTAPTEPTEGAGDAVAGKEVFLGAGGCGSCHTLADAGTAGTVGPNLDAASPSFDKAVERVTNGAGVMPPFADTLTAQQIQDVAAYVSSAAGG